MIRNLSFSAALRRYHEINNVLPDRIIVYRDGVGDGQVWENRIILCQLFSSEQGQRPEKLGYYVLMQLCNSK